MSQLFTPLKIKSIHFRNRLVMSPMCMYSSEDGFATDWHLAHYASRAVGGMGTVILEASAVQAEGRISVGDLGIYKDEHIEGLSRIATQIKQNGAVAGIQLAHAGRKASNWAAGGESRVLHTPEVGGWEVIAPSAIAFAEGTPIPRAMTMQDIEAVQQAFADAATRALKAGFELIEIHSAHGYLLNEFLSPLANQRTDGYGGSRDNRARMLLETINRVKTVWPAELPIAVRISATDWIEAGWSVEDSVWLSEQLSRLGVDIIDVSSGGVVGGVRINIGPGYQVPLASTIKKAVGEKLLIGTVGMITNPEQAETVLVNGDADMVFIGRELLRDPYFALHAAKRLRAEISIPKAYERAF